MTMININDIGTVSISENNVEIGFDKPERLVSQIKQIDSETTYAGVSVPDTQHADERVPATEKMVRDYIVVVAQRSGYTTTVDPDTEELANRYQEGDVVETPDSGVGVIAGAVAEDQTAPEDSDLPDIEASPDSPTYVVVTEDADQGMSLLKASDLEATEIEAEVDALDSTKEAAAMAELAPDDSEIAKLDFTMPESWRESDTPARVIALDAFAGMGGSFDGCVRTMRDAVSNPDALCGSFLDSVLGYEAWRGDSPLPGD
jgi:hypothetical protein